MINIATETLKTKLSDLPEPKAIPFIGHLNKIKNTHMHQVLESWADECGDTFRIRLLNHYLVVTRDPELNHFILKSRPHQFARLRKLAKTLAELDIEGIFTAEGDAWREQRALVNESLKRHHLHQFMPQLEALVSRAEQQCEQYAKADKRLEPVTFFKRFSINVITEYTFGYDVGTIEDRESSILKQLSTIFPNVQRRLNSPFPYWRWFKLKEDRQLDRSLQALKVEIHKIIEHARQEMRQKGTTLASAKNFLETVLLLAEQEGTAIDNRWLFGNIMIMLLAGEDTTASTMAWLSDYLARDPELQSALYDEVKRVFGDEPRHCTLKQLDQLELLDATIQETLRLKPAAPLLFFEAIQDTEFNGLQIPAQSHFILLNRAIAQQESQYEQASRFSPERWLDKERLNNHKRNMLAFGAGPRFCPGRLLSIVETKALFSRLIYHYTFEAVERRLELDEVFNFTMFPEKFGLRLVKRM